MPSSKFNTPQVTNFYDKNSHTFSYVVADIVTGSCAVIDSVLDFDYASGQIHYESADKIIKHVQDNNLKLDWLLETHVHADHLSAAPYIQHKLGGKVAISKHIIAVQQEFGTLFNEGSEFQRDGSQFDVLFEDDQKFTIGSLSAIALTTPGHTPACISYYVGDAVFVGDTLFMPDSGTARADFPGGDASILFKSIQKVLSLPSDTRMFMCHDYQPNGRKLAYLTNVEEQRKNNIHVKEMIAEHEFVERREKRDASLGMPRLIYPSLQVNMRAGNFPAPENNKEIYLKVPINGLSCF